MYIVWFRQDLRLADNPALQFAAAKGAILPIYILEEPATPEYRIGAASRVWLHHSLQALQASLDNRLVFFKGSAHTILQHLCSQLEIQGVCWNRCYEPWRIQRDTQIKQALHTQSIATHSFNGSLLWEPWEVLKADQTPYKVFTPYYRKGCLRSQPRQASAAPSAISYATPPSLSTQTLADLQLLPSTAWHTDLCAGWDISEAGAQQALTRFLQQSLTQYRDGRNFPAQSSVSRLSPYLHHGQLSPHQVWHTVTAAAPLEHTDTYRSELGWREFAYYLLYHFPHLVKQPLQAKFAHFPSQIADSELTAWQQGTTGYPIVDAGMRELWQTGYMHNRVRMIVGSFLVKNLLLDWRAGAAWFWDCLFDADLASNSVSWQWVAGCGADAAPYFRIFNPVTQGEKFDPHGDYTKTYLPQLSHLPDKYLYKPWEAPAPVLQAAGLQLGVDYPHPVVELKFSRNRALDALQAMKAAAATDSL